MRSRDFITFLILFVLLVGLAIVSATQRPAPDPRARRNVPQTTYSADEDGALALHSWLNAVGYRTQRIENIPTFEIDSQTDILFILSPSMNVTAADAATILRWVERGNTLIIADTGTRLSVPLIQALHVEIGTLNDFFPFAQVTQPVRDLTTNTVRVETSHEIKTTRDDAVVFLRAGGKPVLMTFTQGRGQVWVTCAPYLFSNASLRDETNAAFVLSLVNHVSRNSIVAFDEFHHGYRTLSGDRQFESLNALLFQTPWGWALIFAFVVIVTYLFISGQRFGRALPMPYAIARRSPAEYVRAVARLLRRAGKRHFILQHYHRQIKRALGKPYHLNPDLNDEEFVAELARYRELDRTALLEIFHALNPTRVDEKLLVRLTARALETMEHQRG